MVAAANLNFIKKSISPDWIKLSAPEMWEHATRSDGDDHKTESRNRQLIRVTSSNERRQQKGDDLSDYKTYLNQIWYRVQAPDYQHGIYLTWKSKISPDWMKIYMHQIWWEDATQPCGDDRMTKSRNRKLIRMTSLNELREQNGFNFRDYKGPIL